MTGLNGALLGAGVAASLILGAVALAALMMWFESKHPYGGIVALFVLVVIFGAVVGWAAAK